MFYIVKNLHIKIMWSKYTYIRIASQKKKKNLRISNDGENVEQQEV